MGNETSVYLFMEASKPVQAGYNAILESTLMQPTPAQGTCMHFWYHMYGQDMGSLAVHLNASDTRTLKWLQSGNKGDQWLPARVYIRSSRAYRVNIEAIRGSEYRSDIAIDDIDFVESACMTRPAEPLALPPTTTKTTKRRRSKTTTLEPATRRTNDCDFEKSMGIWKQSENDDIQWHRRQGRLGDTSPADIDVDHTTGKPNGWYLFAFLRFTGDTGRLTTKRLLPTSCMEFSYYLSGTVEFEMVVYTRLKKKRDAPLWRRSKTQGEFWKLGRLTVESRQFMFFNVDIKLTQGEYRAEEDNKIALDDITFTEGACADGSAIGQVCTFTNGDTCGYSFEAQPEEVGSFIY